MSQIELDAFIIAAQNLVNLHDDFDSDDPTSPMQFSIALRNLSDTLSTYLFSIQ